MKALMNSKWLRLGFFARHRIKIVMWALVAEMLASPLADSHPRAGALLGLAVLLMVLAGIGHFANRSVVRRVVLPVSGIWIITRLVEAFANPHEPYANLSPVVGLVFSCSILWAIFDHFHSEFRTPRNAIAEAFISYLVLATAYSQLYWILNRFVDHAFNQTIPSTQAGTFLYFSMVTLTSVGYGGIAPLNPYVRIVAALESMSGIFFVAVVVARLVSSYRPKTAQQRQSLAHEAGASEMQSNCECGRV
ncbi:MAG: potassium channel family protein, partial [Candidatus Sulfotelmatobacter sp.]